MTISAAFRLDGAELPGGNALPMSGAGKILKRELRKKYRAATDRNVS